MTMPRSITLFGALASDAYTRVVAPTGAAATARIAGSTNPGTVYVTITPSADLVSKENGAIQYREGNELKLTVRRTQTASRAYYIIRGNPQPTVNYATIRPGANSSDNPGAHMNDWRISIRNGQPVEHAWVDDDKDPDGVKRMHLHIDFDSTNTLLRNRSTLNSLKATIEALDTPFTVDVQGNGAIRPTATINVRNAAFVGGRDAIAAGVEYDEDTKTLTYTSAGSKTLSGVVTDINALADFSAALTGAGATTIESAFSDRAFAGGVNEQAQEAVVYSQGKEYRYHIGTAVPASINVMGVREKGKPHIYFVPAGQGLYLRSYTATSPVTVEIYDAGNHGPGPGFRQGSELTRQ